MAVRVKLRLRRGEASMKVIALVNSGYEADSPRLLVPVNLAKELGLWPPPLDAKETFFETASGPLKARLV